MTQDYSLISIISASEDAKSELTQGVTGVTDDYEREYKLEEMRLKNENLKEYIEGIKQDREQREDFAQKIFTFLCAFEGLVVIILMLSGYRVLILSDSVLITLLSTASANVIGIFMLVARFLFNDKRIGFEAITSKKQSL